MSKTTEGIFSPTEHLKWDRDLEKLVRKLGGWINAHTHLDRANTFAPEFWEYANVDPMSSSGLSLPLKQNLTGYLHEGLAYQPENLYQRMKAELERMLLMKVRKVISFIDATPGIELRAIEQALKLKGEFSGRIELEVAVSPIFGFKNPKENPDRWETYKEAAKVADVLGGLPSRDKAEGRVGIDGHIRMILGLAQELGKPVHLQIDQNNDPREDETEELIQAVRWIGSPQIPGSSDPPVWAVHAISPSNYSEDRFQKMIEGLLKYNIGVICCPSAALSMLQLRPLSTPLHNSIARILEMMEAGVPVQIGTDNICDIFIPNGDGNVRSEIWVAATVLRFYHTTVWAKIGAGIPLNEGDKEWIRQALLRVRETWGDLK